jgi:predicted nuclease of predicted toxin-antitoxin system
MGGAGLQVSVGLYMDENVPGPITSGLLRRGSDVLTAQDEMREGEPDEAVLDRADALGRVVYTTDEDFLAIASDRLHRGIPFTGVFYTAQFGLSIGDCIRDLEIVGACSSFDDWRNQITFIPL